MAARIGIHGVSEEILDLLPALAAHAREARGEGPRVLSTQEARRLWGRAPEARARQAAPPRALAAPIRALVDTLSGLASAFETAGATAAGFEKLLQLGVKALGADGGSLMLLDESGDTLRVRAALGLDAHLWPGIRLPLGEGVAGRVAAGKSPVEIRGPADPERFPGARPRHDRHTALCVPLRGAGQLLGVLNLHLNSPGDAFAPEALGFAQQVGALLADVVERALTQEQTRTHAERFQVQRALRSIFDSGDGLHAQLTAVCRLAAAQAGGGVAQLYMLEEGARRLRLAATSLPTGVPARADLLLPLGEGIEGEVARTQHELRLQGEGGGWLWSLPLLMDGTLAGVLSLQAGGSLRWEAAREGALRELAERLATALLRAEDERFLAQRESDFEQLADASLRMLASRDLGEVLRLGTAEATRTLAADHAVLRLVDARTGQLAVRSYSGSAEGPLQEALFRLDRQLATDLLARNESRRIEDIAGDEALNAHRESAHSAIATLLRGSERPLGTLAVYDKLDAETLEPIRFEARDLERLERFAQHLEHSLANARLRVRTGGQGLLDEETELPQEPFLERRVREELGRSRAATASFALVSVRIENLEILRGGGSPLRGSTLLRRVADSLRSRIRDFDVLVRCAPDEFGLLLPEPGSTPEERVLDLARSVAEDVAKPTRGDATRAQLAFGHASFPGDGDDWERLMARAREARIRNL